MELVEPMEPNVCSSVGTNIGTNVGTSEQVVKKMSNVKKSNTWTMEEVRKKKI